MAKQGCQLSGMGQNSGTLHIDFELFPALRHFVVVFSGMLRRSVECSLTLISFC